MTTPVLVLARTSSCFDQLFLGISNFQSVGYYLRRKFSRPRILLAFLIVCGTLLRRDVQWFGRILLTLLMLVLIIKIKWTENLSTSWNQAPNLSEQFHSVLCVSRLDRSWLYIPNLSFLWLLKRQSPGPGLQIRRVSASEQIFVLSYPFWNRFINDILFFVQFRRASILKPTFSQNFLQQTGSKNVFL